MGRRLETKFNLMDKVKFNYKRNVLLGEIRARTIVESHGESDEQVEKTVHYQIKGLGFLLPIPERDIIEVYDGDLV